MERLYAAHTAQAQIVRDAWTGYLASYYWDWFATLTFHTKIHPEAANKRFLLFLAIIDRAAYGNCYRKNNQGVRWARGSEYQERGILHYHVLISGVQKLCCVNVAAIWSLKLQAGFARIERVKDQQSVSSYVAKCVVKQGDIDIGGPSISWANKKLAVGETARDF